MPDLTLVIGNKNYSSWSLRPWVLLKHLGLDFHEVLVPLNQPQTRVEIDKYGPSGRVPVLHRGDLCVWDSLAICEYICELAGRGWPKQPQARAVARAVTAEMHSGFSNLLSEWPMNARSQNRRTPMADTLELHI